ncbi:Clavaminate synthase-like protein [Rhizophagus irregularis]|uniref:Clavaminate synthase-like protein n=1 Tax=Rhizophagus irregularis TaxID=588596 RepID=A0A2I1GS27_9GLOM|nr:Clavaminate synthase-like protein [Rhizophagus irregularis]
MFTKSNKSTKSPEGVVILDYTDLINNVDLYNEIEEAFGSKSHCLGILLVKNLPEVYVENRARLLRLASVFASLPEEIKEKTVDEQSYYKFGWSCGKEIFNGKKDTLKGSYYGNPKYDYPDATEEELREFPMYCHPNIWPNEDLTEFEKAFKDLGCFIIDVGKLVARACDSFVLTKLPKAEPNYLERIIDESQTISARLLHYFPIQTMNQKNDTDTDDIDDSWCGWHTDHSSLTGLTSSMFVDERDPAYPEIECPDNQAGLYIKNRNDKIIRVIIPRDCLAFQLGAAMQLASADNLRATPHMVKAISSNIKSDIPINVIARNTFAVFMQPSLNEKVGNITFAEFGRKITKNTY